MAGGLVVPAVPVAVAEEGDVETLYVVSREGGNPDNPPKFDGNALWAFCANGDCEEHPDVVTDANDPAYCGAPCKWKFATDSLQNEKMSAPIVVDTATGHDVVYIGQRGGGVCGGSAKVYRVDPSDGVVLDAGLDPADGEPFFPRCGGTRLPNVSFSSPVVSERTGLIYLGGAKGNDPIYRIDPAYPQHNDDADPTADHFDYSNWYAALVWVPLVSGTKRAPQCCLRRARQRVSAVGDHSQRTVLAVWGAAGVK